MYTDFNVTANLTPGKHIRVCNDRWVSFAAFDRVAIIRGSVLAPLQIEEPQAVGLLQLLKTVDSSITPEWAVAQGTIDYVSCVEAFNTGFGMARRFVSTPSKSFTWEVGCWFNSSTQKTIVITLSLWFVREGIFEAKAPNSYQSRHPVPAIFG